MLIWDYIRDFLVQNIFGGVDSNGNFYNCVIGKCTSLLNGDIDDISLMSTGDYNIFHIASDSAGFENPTD